MKVIYYDNSFIPSSNEYKIPELSDKEKQEIMSHPGYFVDDTGGHCIPADCEPHKYVEDGGYDYNCYYWDDKEKSK